MINQEYEALRDLYRGTVQCEPHSNISLLAWAVFRAQVLSRDEAIRMDYEGKMRLLDREHAERFYGKHWEVAS